MDEPVEFNITLKVRAPKATKDDIFVFSNYDELLTKLLTEYPYDSQLTISINDMLNILKGVSDATRLVILDDLANGYDTNRSGFTVIVSEKKKIEAAITCQLCSQTFPHNTWHHCGKSDGGNPGAP